MSAGITLSSYELRKCLTDLSPLLTAGSRTIPVLFKCDGSELHIACTTGCFYRDTIAVSNPDGESWESTVVYKNLLNFVHSSGDVSIIHETFGITIEGEDYTITLQNGYSTITLPNIEGVEFIPIDSSQYVVGLHALMNLGLDKIFADDKPYHLYGDVAVLKYPSIQAQARTPGLRLVAVISSEHVKLLSKFGPTEFATNNVDRIVCKRKSAYLELPMDVKREDNHTLELLDGMSDPVTVSLNGVLDKLRSIEKLDPKGRCKIVLYANGFSVSMRSDRTEICSNFGHTEGAVLSVLYLPIALLLAMVKASGNSTAQFLFKGDLLCLRTQNIIIVVRALV